MKSSQVNEVTKKAVQKAVELLNVTGCSYKIITSYQQEYLNDPKNLISVSCNKSRIKWSEYYEGVDKTEVGEVFTIPFGDFDPAIFQSRLAAHLIHVWGKGSYMTSLNRDSQTLEVLRIR